MKLLLFSDLRLGSEPTFSTLSQIRDLANREAVDIVCCAGNLFDRATATDDTIAFIDQEIGLIRAPMLIAPGPTDYMDDSGPYYRLSSRTDLRIYSQPDFRPVNLTSATLGNVTFWGAAYTGSTRPYRLPALETPSDGIHIALYYRDQQAAYQYAAPGPETEAPNDPFDQSQGRLGLRHALVGGFPPGHTALYTCPGFAFDSTRAAPGDVALVEVHADSITSRWLSLRDDQSAAGRVSDVPAWLARILDGPALRILPVSNPLTARDTFYKAVWDELTGEDRERVFRAGAGAWTGEL
jgi:hypothetical protein